MDLLFDFTGKVVLAIGEGRGLGHRMVKAVAERGADVTAASRKLTNCEAVAAKVGGFGRRSLAVAAHVGRRAGCDALTQTAWAAFGGSTSSSTTPGCRSPDPAKR